MVGFLESNNKTNRPKVGLVVGGGGLKCLSALPFIEFLKDNNIKIDLMVGCSGGGLILSMVGLGYSAAEIQKLFTENLNKKLVTSVDYRTIFSLIKLPFMKFDKSNALLKMNNLKRLYKKIFKDTRLEDISPKTLIQATDFNTCEGVVISKGLLRDVVYASGAMYPFMPPALLEGRWVADGGYSSELPVLEAVKNNVDVILAISFSQKPNLFPDNFIEQSFGFLNQSIGKLQRTQSALAIDLHHHEIIFVNIHFDKIINFWDVHELPNILEMGKSILEEKKQDIMSTIKSFSEKKG